MTSRAVVGSSATTNEGWPATAIAIITRWRRPPDSSWGNAPARRTGSGTPTASRSRTASPAEPAASATWRPTGIVGLSEVIGSWNTAPRWSRLTTRRCSGWAATMSRPHTTADPVTAGGGWVGSRPSKRQPEHALARARLADQAQDLAAPDRHGHAPDGRDTVRPLRSNDTWRSSTVTTGASRPVLSAVSSSTAPAPPGSSLVEGAGDASGWNDMADCRHHLAE